MSRDTKNHKQNITKSRKKNYAVSVCLCISSPGFGWSQLFRNFKLFIKEIDNLHLHSETDLFGYFQHQRLNQGHETPLNKIILVKGLNGFR